MSDWDKVQQYRAISRYFSGNLLDDADYYTAFMQLEALTAEMKERHRQRIDRGKRIAEQRN